MRVEVWKAGKYEVHLEHATDNIWTARLYIQGCWERSKQLQGCDISGAFRNVLSEFEAQYNVHFQCRQELTVSPSEDKWGLFLGETLIGISKARFDADHAKQILEQWREQ